VTDISENEAERIRRLADDGSGGLADVSQIASSVESEFARYGQVITDLADLPADANIRARGYFVDPGDLLEYLERGGMVSTQNGQYVPVSWVYLYKTWNEGLQEYTYQVYIRDTSE
jgi:hypothetical protein